MSIDHACAGVKQKERKFLQELPTLAASMQDMHLQLFDATTSEEALASAAPALGARTNACRPCVPVQ